MKQFSKDLGNVSLAPKGKWSREQEYERLALVYNTCDNLSYVAKINVPSGVDIENREYWQPMNATGYADNNFINLTTENENGTITAYESLEEAVATILPINRRAGATLSFYNLNADRLDRQAEFELWQFNSTDLANWEIRDYWNNIYYNWNVFAGWYVGADALKNHVKIPNVGQYAYVGTNLSDAILYQCRTNGTWTNTGIKVRIYISVVVSGNITIGENGNWFSNGEDTGIPATPAVDEQFDNIMIQLQQHTTEINNLKAFDTNLQNQITSNDSDIATLNTKHESLNKTVQGIAATGGASTATNVTYDNDTSGLNSENIQDAIDEIQGSKIDKTSILQESGGAEDKVMSQKTVSDKLSDLSTFIGFTPVAVRSGSMDNLNNKNSVCMKYIMNVQGNSFAYCKTNRPNQTGCHYEYTFNTYSIKNGATSSNVEFKLRDRSTPKLSQNKVKLTDEEKGIAFGIYEVDASGNKQSLCVDDFNGYEFLITVYESIEKLNDRTLPLLGLNVYCNKENKCFNIDNSNNTLTILSTIRFNYKDSEYSIDEGKTLSYERKGYTYAVVLSEDLLNIELLNINQTQDKVVLAYFGNKDGLSRGVSFAYSPIGLVCTIDGKDDYDKKIDKISIASTIGNSNDKVMSQKAISEQLQPSLLALLFSEQEIRGGISINLRNGSPLNLNNAFSVCDKYIFKKDDARMAIIKTNRPNSQGCVYHYAIVTFSVSEGDAHDCESYKIRDLSVPKASQNEIVLTDEEKGIAFGIYEVDASGNKQSLRVEDFDGYYIGIRFLNNKEWSLFKGIFKDVEAIPMEEKLLQLKRKAPIGATSPLSETKNMITLLHFSDIHGDTENIERIMQFYSEYNVYLSDIIHTGDSVYNNIHYGNPFDKINGAGSKILNVIGNHDCQEDSTNSVWYSVSAAEAYETYFKEYISKWNVNSPGEGLCYYYKDYNNSNDSTPIIRVVAIDCMHYDNTQQTWFRRVLSETIEKGYTLVVACHYPPANGVDEIPCSFTNLDIHVPILSGEKIEAMESSIYDDIDTYITNGGKFACWLVGHTHANTVCTPKGHEKQLMILVANAGDIGYNPLDVYNEASRIRGTKTQDCFNIVSIDTDSKLLKIVRVGVEFDRYMRHQGTLCINYENKKVLANT